MRPLRIKLRKGTHYYMIKRINGEYFLFFMISPAFVSGYPTANAALCECGRQKCG